MCRTVFSLIVLQSTTAENAWPPRSKSACSQVSAALIYIRTVHSCGHGLSTMEITFPHTRFAAPKPVEEILQMRQNAVPLKTRQDTAYCLRVWDAWAACRNENTELIDKIPPLLQITTEKLQFWITRFVLETRKKDGTELSTKLTIPHCDWSHALPS